MKSYSCLNGFTLPKFWTVFAALIAIGFPAAASAQDVLFISDIQDNTVKRFRIGGAAGDPYEGIAIPVCSQNQTDCLASPQGLVIDGLQMLLVNQNANQPFAGEVLRYQFGQGAWSYDSAVVPRSSANAPFAPRGMIKDGNLAYVANMQSDGQRLDGSPNEGSLLAFDATTNEFKFQFSTTGFTGPFYPRGVVLGPDHLLYVTAMGNPDEKNNSIVGKVGYVLRFDPSTQALKDVFVANDSANNFATGLESPEGLVFGPDGRLYVTSGVSTFTDSAGRILIFDASTGGSPIDSIELHPGELKIFATALVFGPGNKLYVPISLGLADCSSGSCIPNPHPGEVRAYDVVAKSYTVVSPGGLNSQLFVASYLSFASTDPATLNYLGANPASAELSVSLAVTPVQPSINDDLTYSIHVGNDGPGSASNVQVTVNLPAAATLTSSDNGCIANGATLSCTFGSLASAASMTKTFVLRPNQTGNLHVDATVSASESDPNLFNNQANIDITVFPPPDLSVTLTNTPNPVGAGNQLTYEAQVSYVGPGSAEQVQLVVTLPATSTLVSQGSGCSTNGVTITCEMGNISSGPSSSITIVVRPSQAGTITATASVSGNAASGDPSNDVATAEAVVYWPPDLAVSLIAIPDGVAVGSNLTYSATVDNLGTGTASNALLMVNLPEGTTLVSADTGCTLDLRTVTCDLGNLASDAHVARTIVAKADRTGILSASASTGSAETDSNTDNNQAQTSTCSGVLLADPGQEVSGNLGSTVTLDGSGSNDPVSGKPLKFLWSWQSGPARPPLVGKRTKKLRFTPPLPGDYVLALTVNNRNGVSCPRQVTVRVPAAIHVTAPLAGATLSQGVVTAITWETVSIHPNKALIIFLSTDGGSHWKRLKAGIKAGTATWSWIPDRRKTRGLPTEQAQLKVCLPKTLKNAQLCGISEGTFAVH